MITDYKPPSGDQPDRRRFLGWAAGGVLAAPSLMEASYRRAAWVRGMAKRAGSAKLFEIIKAADDVYLAMARTQALINSSSVIFVNAKDVLVVDSQTRPSASAALIRQIRAEITPKAVRYVVNTHFHDDHSQGNSAYKQTGNKVDFLATNATAELMKKEVPVRLKQTMEHDVPALMEICRAHLAKASSTAEKAFWKEMIAQYKSFLAEMKDFTLEPPTIAFDKSHVVKDSVHELQVAFHGRAHTAGDVVVFCPEKQVVATGDMIQGTLPYMPDGYPREWVTTVDSVSKLDYIQALPGHGPIMRRDRVTNFRNFIEEMNTRVAESKKAGKTLEETRKSITVASLKSLQDNRYGEYVTEIHDSLFPHWGQTFLRALQSLQGGVDGVTGHIYRKIA